MKVFSAKVVDGEGKERTITEETISRELFENSLYEKGYYILKISEGNVNKIFSQSKSISDKFIIDFCHNIYSLLNFGIDINEVFRILTGIYKKDREGEIVRNIYKSLNKGEKFSEILRKEYPKDFNDFIFTMISAGESSGRLKESFKLINQFLKTTKKIRDKIQSASLYPIILIIVSFVVLNLILFVTVPNFGKIYEDMNFTPSFLVRVMINISTFLKENVIFYITFLLIIAIAFIFIKVNKIAVTVKDRIIKRMPLISKIILLQEKIRVTFSIEILLKGGFSVENALRKISEFEKSQLLKKEYIRTEESLKSGESINKAFNNIKSFNYRDLNILGISDSISESLAGFEKIREDSESELETFLEKIFKMIEPAMMIVIGIFIFFVMYLVISPTIGMLEKF